MAPGAGSGGLFAWRDVQAGGGGGLCRASRMSPRPPPCLGGKRQEPAEASLTWILWWGCGQPAPRCQASARTSLCSCPCLLPVTRGGWAEERSSGCYAPKFSLSLLFLLCGRGGCQGRRSGGVGGVLGIPHPGGPSPTSIPWCHQGHSRQVAAVQVLLVCDLGMLQGLGVTSSPQNCPL